MKKWMWLTIIAILALGLRLVVVDRRPSGFTWDEAALGYNAYSLFQTGRDEYGNVLPVVLKSFGDYKPGLYAYLAVPTVAGLGLSETATRLPSVLAGTLLVLAVYFLASELVGHKAALWTSLVMATSPWAIHFSRGAWEANVALLLTSLGAVLFLRKRYYHSFAFLGLTFWIYQGAKLFTPLLLLGFFFINRKLVNLKSLFLPSLVGLALVLPVLVGIGTQSGRLKVFSVFSYRHSDEAISKILGQDNLPSKNWLFYLFHSEAYDQLRGIVQRYTNHFSSYFLFVAGDWTNGRHSVPYYGYFHWPDLILMLLGVVVLLRTPNYELRTNALWLWLALAPLPAALSRDLVSGVRSLPMIVPLSILAGVGLARLARRRILLLCYLVASLFFVGYFADLYFVHAPFFTSSDWLVAYKWAWQEVKANYSNYQKVVFTDKLGQPYIFGLFYLQIDPREYQHQASLIANQQGDVGQVSGFDKFEFRPISWPADQGLTNTLFVGGEYELPGPDLDQTANLVRLGQINYPNNTVGLKVVGVR